jgi:alpha-L-rhamnosidase
MKRKSKTMNSKIHKIILPLAVVLIVSIFLTFCRRADSPAVVYDLRCEYQVAPLGVERQHPLLQWKLADSRRGAVQTAWQVLVSGSLENLERDEGDLWDSGKNLSDQSVTIRYAGKPLESGATCFWKVRIWDRNDEVSAWSEPAFWEMGLLNPSDWQAQWVARDGEDPDRSVYMRQEIQVPDKKLEKARVVVTGLGNYVFYINGTRVGKDLLTPGWTHYPERLEYRVYDVTSSLKPGANCLGALLGNMWWSGGLGWQGGQKYSQGPLKFYLQLEMLFEDGSREMVGTEPSWKWHDSPIVADNIYDGEIFDATLVQEGWNRAGFDDSAWAPVEPATYEGKLSGPYAPPLREHQSLDPIALSEPVRGEYVFDMGQNMVGWVKIKVDAEKGDTLVLRYAELLHDDGTVAQENLRSAEATDRIIAKGEEFFWEPKFTYHGFRYVQVSGLKEKPAIQDVEGKVIYADAPIIGTFACSNELINQIYRNITWAQRGNFYAVPTDCPQRDERLGWMGDAQIFAPTANFTMDLARYWAKWMVDITDGQDSEGWVYDVNPPIVVRGPSKPGWGDAVVIIPWHSYRWFGDVRILEDHYEGMKAWVEYMNTHSKEYIYVWSQPGSEGWYGYGDWIAVEPTPSKPIGTAYFYYSTHLLSRMAEIIGKDEEAEKYAALAEKIANAYQKEYWDAEAQNYVGGTQTANLLPLAFGITPEELRDQVVTNLVENVSQHGGHPTTGFLGTGYILPMLSKYGHHDMAYEMINKTDYPSWGYMVKKGATTIWELWNSDSEPPDEMNSRNHFALGCVGEWMWNTLVGLNICEHNPGFKRMIIKPQPSGDLKWVKAAYETNYGKISVEWRSEEGFFTLNLTVPPNTSAVVELPVMFGNSVIREGGIPLGSSAIDGLSETPCGKILAGAGEYVFTVEAVD